MMGQAIQWDAVFQEYRSSGLSRQAFCNQHQLSYTQFRYRWYRQDQVSGAKEPSSRIKSNAAAFETVTVTSAGSSIKPSDKVVELAIHLPNQIRCDIKVSLDTNELPKFLQQLVALC